MGKKNKVKVIPKKETPVIQQPISEQLLENLNIKLKQHVEERTLATATRRQTLSLKKKLAAAREREVEEKLVADKAREMEEKFLKKLVIPPVVPRTDLQVATKTKRAWKRKSPILTNALAPKKRMRQSDKNQNSRIGLPTKKDRRKREAVILSKHVVAPKKKKRRLQSVLRDYSEYFDEDPAVLALAASLKGQDSKLSQGTSPSSSTGTPYFAGEVGRKPRRPPFRRYSIGMSPLSPTHIYGLAVRYYVAKTEIPLSALLPGRVLGGRGNPATVDIIKKKFEASCSEVQSEISLLSESDSPGVSVTTFNYSNDSEEMNVAEVLSVTIPIPSELQLGGGSCMS